MFKSFFGVQVTNEQEFQSGNFSESLRTCACCVWADQDLPAEQRIPTIIFNSSFEKLLTEEEIIGVLRHEVGHLLAGHVAERIDINSLQCEIEADAYAISQGTTPAELISTLYKTAWWLAGFKARGATEDERSAKAIHLLESNTEVCGRLNALKKL